jgi:hypothetical protein
MFRWHYGLAAVLGLVVGYMGVKGVSLVAWMNAPVRVMPHTVRLGEMVEGNDASFSVNLINRTEQPLRLVRVHYSVCGCFFEQKKLPEIIAPRSNVSLAFGVRTEQLPDQFRAQLTFVLTNPSGATFTPAVTLIGSVRREIAVTPAFLDFGTVLLGGGDFSHCLPSRVDWESLQNCRCGSAA